MRLSHTHTHTLSACRPGAYTLSFTAEYAEIEPSRAEIDATRGPLLLEFGAPWCPHCQVIQPTLQKLFERFSEVRHIKIYDGRGRPLGRSFRVKLWPNLVFMKDGKVMLQHARPGDDEIADGLRILTSVQTPE